MSRSCTTVVIVALSIAAFSSLPTQSLAQPDEAKKAAIQELLIKAEDEYRLFFRKPKTPFEFWAAIDFEIKTGKYDVASLLLDQLVKLQPKDKTDDKLLEIEELKGMSAFLNLNTVKQWHENPDLQKEAEKNVKELIDRVTVALDKKLSDPARINKLIGQLDAPSLDERAYAFKQLKRTKQRAAPYLVDALIKTVGKKEHERIKGTILLLDWDVMPPLLEVLKAADDADYKEKDLRYAILEIFRQKDDRSAVPYLWHMSTSEKYPPIIRAKAKQVLASLLEIPEEKLPAAHIALTELAENYYKHQVIFKGVLYAPKGEGQYVKFWAWNKGQMLDRKPQDKSVSEMETMLALRHVKEALDLAPNYRPAQKLLTTLILDQSYGQSLDQFFLKPMPVELHNLLTSLDSDLLMEVLSQAFRDHNTPVILPLVQILGERGESKAALPTLDGSAQGLVKALYYPDRRVQLAGIRSLLALPGEQPPAVRARIMELLQQFLLTEATSRSLVIGTPEGQEIAIRDALKKAGAEGVLVPDRKQAFAKLHQSADFDFVLVHPGYPAKELPYLLAELRADSSAGLLPVLIFAPPKTLDALKPAVAKFGNVFLVPDVLIGMPDKLKTEMPDYYKLAQAPAFLQQVSASQKPRVIEEILNNKSIPLSASERKIMSAEAMDLLWKMSHGTVKGFSLNPAKPAIQAAILSKDHAEKAIDTFGNLSGADVQQRLAGLVLDNTLDKKLRLLSTYKLQQHILKHGLVLNKVQIAGLRDAHAAAMDPDLRKLLSLIMTQLPPSDKTGPKLSDFTPKPVK